MKKSLSLFLALILISTSAFAGQVVGFEIPDNKVAYAAEGFLISEPNNKSIPDPEWVDPDDGSTAPMISQYTTLQWVNYCAREWFKKRVFRGHALKAIDDAKAGLSNDSGIIG